MATSTRMEIYSMGNNQIPRIFFTCAYCGELGGDKPSSFRRKTRHFCSTKCYAKYRTELLPIEEHPKWQGGISAGEAHKRWKARHPERMAFLRHKEYLRHKNVSGGHSFEDWQRIKLRHGNKCAICGQEKPLTKDHVIPLSLGGTDDVGNIQPLCRSCNSRKWKFNIYENPDLIPNLLP